MLEAKTAEPEQIGTPQWTASEVERYLRTGEYDGFFVGWPGSNLADIATLASQRLRSALVTETMRRSKGFESVSRLPVDLHAWNSEKLKPMVDGLFNPSERATVIRLLSDNVVFVTRANLVKILMAERWLSTAWDVANIFLESLKAPTLSGQPRNIVGLSQETTCYVSWITLTRPTHLPISSFTRLRTSFTTPDAWLVGWPQVLAPITSSTLTIVCGRRLHTPARHGARPPIVGTIERH